VRSDKDLNQRKVVLLMDNAVIHKYSELMETIRKFKVVLLFNAEYSPWLNPIEQLFSYVKAHLKT
jgi:transposase